MSRVLSLWARWIESACERLNIPFSVGLFLVLLPLIIVPIFGVLILVPATRGVGLLLLQENNVVETSTFMLLLTAGLYGMHQTWTARSSGHSTLVGVFLGVFSLGLLFVAMEEIAWGQQFLHFNTPEIINRRNLQGELTLHNIKGLQGNSEIFRLIFGIGGLVGVAVRRFPRLQPISVDPLLLPFLLVITAVSAVDTYNDLYSLGENIDTGVQRMSELVEMLIGCAALAYVVSIARRQKTAIKS